MASWSEKLWLAVSTDAFAVGAICVMVCAGGAVKLNACEIDVAAYVVDAATEASIVQPPVVVKCKMTGALEEVSEQPPVSPDGSIA